VQIAVIGTGKMGRGFAAALSPRHEVILGSRNPDRATAVLRATGAARVLSPAEAAAGADAVILAVPWQAIEETAARLGDLAGAVVVDVTVPITVTDGTLMLADVPEGSAAEHVRARLPPPVRVAATFKTVPAGLLGDGTRPLDCDEFVCGDSPESRARALELVRAVAGLRPIDVGPLARARAIEHLTLLAIAINKRHKMSDARFRVIGL